MPLLVRCTELTKKEDDHKCQSYSYNRDKQQCVLSEDRINYDPEYDYYENKQRVDGDPAELSDDTKKRKLVERDEELAAKKSKKLRLKMESQEREEELAEMQRNQVAKRVAAEAKGKMVANKEVQAKADELTLKQTETIRAAREQGEYLESVQKASLQVAHASKNVKKHKLAGSWSHHKSFATNWRNKRKKQRRKSIRLQRRRTCPGIKQGCLRPGTPALICGLDKSHLNLLPKQPYLQHNSGYQQDKNCLENGRELRQNRN